MIDLRQSLQLPSGAFPLLLLAAAAREERDRPPVAITGELQGSQRPREGWRVVSGPAGRHRLPHADDQRPRRRENRSGGGLLAAFCLDRSTLPRAVRNDPRLLENFQSVLSRQGIDLRWPSLTLV